MRKISLVDYNDRFLGKINLPESPEEVRFSQMIDFVKTTERLYEEIAQQTDQFEPLTYLARHIEILAEFFREDKDIFMNMDLGQLNQEDALEMDQTVMGLFNYIQGMMRYEPKLRDKDTFKFKYKGEEFEIPFFRASAWMKGILRRPDLKIGEVVEALEIHRLKSFEMETDATGSHWYTRDVYTLACLARKHGEVLPKDPAGLKQWLEERMYFFQDIDLVTALDAAFFLKTTMLPSNKRNRSNSFLTLRNLSRMIRRALRPLRRLRRIMRGYSIG